MKKVITLIFLISTLNSLAQQPVDGFWWNPDESGRGITIETQNNKAVAAFYAYDDMNLGRWYLGNGTIVNGVLQGQWSAFDGGQCSNCQHTSPVINPSQSKGDFTVTFNTARKATMQWAGGTMPLERFMFAYPNENSYLFGVWSFSQLVSATLVPTQFLFMNSTVVSNGQEFVAGNYVDFSARPVVSGFLEVGPNGENQYSMLIDASTSFYRFYIFQLTKNKMTGRGWLYRKDSSPVGQGTVSLGAKYSELPPPSSIEQTDIKEFGDYIETKLEAEFQIQNKAGNFNTKYLDQIEVMEGILKNM